MTDNVDVTVVIPSFNSEPFLTRSVLTCLSQVGVKVEVIVVDDEGKDLKLTRAEVLVSELLIILIT